MKKLSQNSDQSYKPYKVYKIKIRSNTDAWHTRGGSRSEAAKTQAELEPTTSSHEGNPLTTKPSRM